MGKHWFILMLAAVVFCGLCVERAEAQSLGLYSRGPAVKKWQLFLIEQGFMEPPAFGNFERRTVLATAAFQRRYGLDGLGVVGPKTLRIAKSLGFGQPRPSAPSLEKIAAYWAPVICQDMDATNYRAEYLTKFDYDNDFIGDNNWNNLNRYALPGYVYNWVSETSTHYFIGYAFFHPRDWTSSVIKKPWDEHENDMEGLLLTIKKQASYGQFISMITVAHSDFWSYTDKDDPSGPSRLVTDGNETIDGDVDFVSDDFGLHPVVYLQSEGHGVFGVKNGQKGLGNAITDFPPIFDRNQVTNWQGVNWNGIRLPTRSGSPTTFERTGNWNDGIIYHYENTVDVPAPAGVTRKDALFSDWQVVGYNLLPINGLWERRNDNVTFAKYGFFAGNDGKDNAANAPWGWDDKDDGPVSAPIFFIDPAYLVSYYFGGLTPFSRTYVRKSYENAVSPVITVNINRVHQIDNLDTDPIVTTDRADFYSQVTIAEETRRSDTVGGKDDALPNWRFTGTAHNSVRIVIRLYDEDGGLAGGDDHCDINPRPGIKDLSLTYDLNTGRISGDATGTRGNPINVRGAGDSDKAEIWFSINHN